MRRVALLAVVAAGLCALACGGAAPTAVDQPASRRAEAWALLLWFLVAAIALLGVAQPRIA